MPTEPQFALDEFFAELQCAEEHVARAGKLIDFEWASALLSVYTCVRPLFRKPNDEIATNESLEVLMTDILFAARFRVLSGCGIDAEWYATFEERGQRVVARVRAAAAKVRPDEIQSIAGESAASREAVEAAEAVARISLAAMKAELRGDAAHKADLEAALPELCERMERAHARVRYYRSARDRRLRRVDELSAREVDARVVDDRATDIAAQANDDAHTCWRTTAPPPPEARTQAADTVVQPRRASLCDAAAAAHTLPGHDAANSGAHKRSGK